MKRYQRMLLENKAWAQEKREQDSDFFTRMSQSQKPETLWIGCSDSRVSPTEITQSPPGEIFIHRNIANVVVHTDLNLLSVLQYAVEVLQVSHVIVCGHYGCGGVQAAMSNKSLGLIDIWLRHIKDAYCIHKHDVDSAPDDVQRLNRMVEANVKQQVRNLAKTSIIQQAWKYHKMPYLHGWVFDMSEGVIIPQVELGPHDEFDDPIYNYEPFKV